jgi:cell wall-associated NlpC family hydrolase
MVQAFAHLHVDPSKINYPVGQTSQVYWNVAESGCGKTPVTVQNTATATLLTYTPYVPNAASLAAYPGTGDACSAYGNRNFYRMFTQWFGSTGGGKPVAAGGGVAGVAVALNGPVVTIPDHPNVVPALRGYQLTTGSAGIAKGLAAGFAQLGKPYVWGGWNDDGCGRGGGDKNSCQGVGAAVGGSFDCSGLTAYVIMQGGFPSPGDNSGAQAQSSHAVPWPGAPGDIIHFPGHVAIDLGSIGGQVYILEASDVGTPIRIVAMFRTDNDPTPYRYWS